jgi:hypothetical protein
MLLLVLLPLYLWPLRAGLGALPGASALSGPPRDPRDAAALAAIPADVWDDLMGRTPPGTSSPRNLTMISELEEIAGAGPFDFGEAGYSRGLIGSPTLGWLTSDPLDGASDFFGGQSGFGDSSPSPAQSMATLIGNSGTGWGGYPGASNLGPWGGGGRGAGSPGGNQPDSGPGPIWDSSDPPAPTPEPATIVLIGSNVMLFGAAAWRRRRRGRGTGPSE